MYSEIIGTFDKKFDKRKLKIPVNDVMNYGNIYLKYFEVQSKSLSLSL